MNDEVEFSGQMLSVQLGPGLLTQIYDGLQNPLPKMAEEFGVFLPVGEELDAIDMEKKWEYSPTAKIGDTVTAGDVLGTVQEGMFTHKIMVPFNIAGEHEISEAAKGGSYGVTETIATIKDDTGKLKSCRCCSSGP